MADISSRLLFIAVMATTSTDHEETLMALTLFRLSILATNSVATSTLPLPVLSSLRFHVVLESWKDVVGS